MFLVDFDAWNTSTESDNFEHLYKSTKNREKYYIKRRCI